MNDKELLELAAKAAGIDDAKYQNMAGWGEVRHGLSEAMSSDTHYDETGTTYWNPLVNDGDALRLAVKLGLFIDAYGTTTTIGRVVDSRSLAVVTLKEEHGNGPNAATRRAIVRAAAEIGRTK